MDTQEVETQKVESQRVEFTRNTIKLTAEQWEMLHDLAAATNSLAPTGTKAFEPSWRTLVKRIADGEFVIKPAKRQRAK